MGGLYRRHDAPLPGLCSSMSCLPRGKPLAGLIDAFNFKPDHVVVANLTLAGKRLATD